MDSQWIDNMRNKLYSLDLGADWYLDVRETDSPEFTSVTVCYNNRGVLLGCILYISAGGYGSNGRISVGISFPKDSKGGNHVNPGKAIPDINIGETKSAIQIVSDIKRRLLPGVEALYPLVKASIDSTEAYLARKSATGAMCQGIMPSLKVYDDTKDHSRGSQVRLYSPYEQSPSIEIDANGSGAKLTIDCTDSQLAELMTYIKGISKGTGK